MVDSDNEQGGQVVDPERMRDLAENLGEDGLRDVIETYLEDVPGHIQNLRAAYERGEREEVQRIAHSLKSSSGIFGASEMVRLCRALETGDWEAGASEADLISAISAAFEKLRVVLNLYLQK